MNMPSAIAVFIIMILIMSIATASIAMECYNENPAFETSSSTRQSNKDYLKFALWVPVGVLGLTILHTGASVVGYI